MQVQEVRGKIHEYVKQGGVRPAPPAEKSKLMVGLDVFTGKALPSDLIKKDTSPVAAAARYSASPVSRSSTLSIHFLLIGIFYFCHSVSASDSAPSAPPAPPASSSFSVPKSNPFAAGDAFAEEAEPPAEDEEESGNPFSSAPPAPPVPPAAAASANMVEALFDHEAEEEDELNFSAGDMVEVIDRADGGWWRGRCHGKEGLFPSNYVKS